MLSLRRVTALFVLGGSLGVACGSAADRSGWSGSTPQASDPAPAPLFDEGGVTSQSVDEADCSERAKSIYVFDNTSSLRRFDPTTAKFTLVGELDCAGTRGDPTSMAVDRAGKAWVLFSDGHVFQVSTTDASCKRTRFEPRGDEFTTFGMGFASDGEDGATDTLYVASATDPTLGKLDLDSMTITPIARLDDQARVELTGTGSGQLFGLIEGDPWTIAELSTTSANTLAKKPQRAINGTSPTNFAFAAWGGDFYSFVGSSVYRYDTETNKVSKVATTNFRVVGAGVSTCAPHAVVK